MEYMHDTVSKYHIDDHIRFHHKVSKAEWSSQSQEWALTADREGRPKRYLARWIIISTGPGRPPQFWPRDFAYANQKLALLGSGATAVSLLPAIAKEAGHVTMIQRSPTYVAARRSQNGTPKMVPHGLVLAWRWLYWLVQPYLIVLLAHRFPNVVRDSLTQDASKELPASVPVDPHFTPRYDPWRERLCLDPNGAFFQAFHQPNVRLITGQITAVTDHSIQMRSGESVDSDVIVTATGHRMVLGGKIDIRVDGEHVDWGGRFVWNGAMLDGVPNMMFMLGYTNHSWTLGADNTAMYLLRLMSYMKRKGARSALPRVPETVATGGTQGIWQLDSTYVREAEGRLPVCGNTGPWKPKNRPPIDWFYARWGNFTKDLDFSM